MPADNEHDPLDRWLGQQVQPLPPPDGTFELITRRARRRKVRKAVLSIGAGAVVAAAIAVAVPVSMSLNVATPAQHSVAAGGSATTGPQTDPGPLGTAAKPAMPASSPTAPTPASSASSPASGALSSPGSLPSNFEPSSVTWDSLSDGWIIGQAGTPGQCAGLDPSICTSVARTTDGGRTWSGLPAPVTGAPSGESGVGQIRFLNGTYGWAFAPELWATDNGGESWHQVSTGGSAVTGLETADGRAFALFGNCPPPADGTIDVAANCSSYTLKTAAAGSDDWIAVSGVPAGLSAAGGAKASAQIVLGGSDGYLVAPDGSLYSGPLDGGAWSKVSDLPCTPKGGSGSGLPVNMLLASGATSDLALVCVKPSGPAATAQNDLVTYQSANQGATWTERQTSVTGIDAVGLPDSFGATSAGTLIMATWGGNAGIWLLAPGAASWQRATLSDPAQGAYGFTYVGMTSPTQGVALGGLSTLDGIWMTSDGGQSWTVRPIAK